MIFLSLSNHLGRKTAKLEAEIGGSIWRFPLGPSSMFFFYLDLNFLFEFHHVIFSCHNSDMLFCLGSLLSFSSCISLVMLCFSNEIPRGNLCKFHKILLLMYSRMPWGSSGNWLIPIGKSLLLNQSYGRTWVGKALTHQQILGIHMFRFLMLFNCRLILLTDALPRFRGGGFISLENLIFFAKNYPVTTLFDIDFSFSVHIFF